MDEDIEFIDEEGPIIEEEVIDDIDIGSDVTRTESGGHQTVVTRAEGVPTSNPAEQIRTYTEVSAGKITMGTRLRGSLDRTPRATMQGASSSTYYGLAIAADRIMIASDKVSGGADILLQTGSNYGKTGYLKVITAVDIRQLSCHWTVEELPFRNGICITHE